MKLRLDQLLVERGLAASRERAQALIRAGLVVVGEQRVEKPGAQVDGAAPVRLKGEFCPYVSRGGLKLAGALEQFGLKDLTGRLAADIGASTGGFTDCLLQHGVECVRAIDTGRGQLHERLRQDARVILREQANARFLTPDWVGGQKMDLVVIDVSFISLRLVLPPLPAILAPGGTVLALVKPQFEAGPGDVGRGGVVREARVHRRVVREISNFAQAAGWLIFGVAISPLAGPAGNREFFLWLARPLDPAATTSDPTLTTDGPAPPTTGRAPLTSGHTPLTDDEIQIAIERVLSEAYT